MQYEHPLSGTPMHRIDIDSLSEEELIELNHKVVARLRFLNQMRSHSAMLDFRIGERVKFHPTGSPEVTGILTRYPLQQEDGYGGHRFRAALECSAGVAQQNGFRFRWKHKARHCRSHTLPESRGRGIGTSAKADPITKTRRHPLPPAFSGSVHSKGLTLDTSWICTF